MRAADVISVVFALVLAGAGVGGFLYWQAENKRAELARYEAGVDEMFERKMQAVWRDTMVSALATPNDNLATLRSLYENDADYDQLNLGFGTLRGDWRTDYANYAEQAGREVVPGRFQAEVDERFGAGAHDLMAAKRFLAEAPARAQAQYEQRMQEQQALARALADYVRRNGRYPTGPIRVENGRIVETAP